VPNLFCVHVQCSTAWNLLFALHGCFGGWCTSALEVNFNVVRSINLRFTYLLTYLLLLTVCLRLQSNSPFDLFMFLLVSASLSVCLPACKFVQNVINGFRCNFGGVGSNN